MKPYVRRDEGLLVRDLGEEILILDAVSNQVHQLNATASFIWRKLDSVDSPDRLGELLTEEFDVPVDRARTDVLAALDGFKAAGLFQRDDGSTANNNSVSNANMEQQA